MFGRSVQRYVTTSVFASSALHHSFEHRPGQTKDYEIGICCFFAKHATLSEKNKGWLARNQLMCPNGETCLFGGCCFSKLLLTHSLTHSTWPLSNISSAIHGYEIRPFAFELLSCFINKEFEERYFIYNLRKLKTFFMKQRFNHNDWWYSQPHRYEILVRIIIKPGMEYKSLYHF